MQAALIVCVRYASLSQCYCVAFALLRLEAVLNAFKQETMSSYLKLPYCAEFIIYQRFLTAICVHANSLRNENNGLDLHRTFQGTQSALH